MNKTEPRPLLKLYELLWEYVKGKDIIGLLTQTTRMNYHNLITDKEMCLLDMHILDEKNKLGGFVNSKDFVQRMIKELENDK